VLAIAALAFVAAATLYTARGFVAAASSQAPLSPSLRAQRVSGQSLVVGGGFGFQLAEFRSCRRPFFGSRRTAAAVVVAAVAAGSVGVVLLSAGVGKRMGANIPKQYLKLLGLEIALHSLDVFLRCPLVSEIVVVSAEEWRSVFEDHVAALKGPLPAIKYTGGGAERQDSVKNGLAEITSEYVAVHDAARPLVTVAEVEKVVAEAREHGAALLAVQTKATIKQAVEGSTLVAATPKRKTLWEAHTPQVIRADLLREGFANAAEKNLEVTDDVSLVEALGKPVKLTEGEYTNLKVTTPEDIAVAETILRERGYQASGAN